jgi:hypothetical protein
MPIYRLTIQLSEESTRTCSDGYTAHEFDAVDEPSARLRAEDFLKTADEARSAELVQLVVQYEPRLCPNATLKTNCMTSLDGTGL